MRPVIPIVVVLLLVAVGCGTRSAGNLDRMKNRIEDLNQSLAEKDRRIEELNNRIFLLEDKVDTSRVAQQSSGSPVRLPVVRLTPAPPDEEGERSEEADGTEEDAPESSSLVEDRGVTFSGEARAEGPRPVLRLYGPDAGSGPITESAPVGGARSVVGGASVSAALAGPDPGAVKDSLAVVPLPPRALAKRVAGAPLQPMRDYESALSMYRAGKHTAAAEAFRSFVHRYTEHAYADNAMYWLGECFYDMKNYRLALQMFRRVVEEYPKGNKAPDALLKMAYSYLKLEEKANAKTVLGQLLESYPRSEVAQLASQALVQVQ